MEKLQYQYRPLEGDDTIRILTLDAGQPSDPLAATLEVVPIQSAGSYEAVSYIWVDPGLSDRPHQILIHDDDSNGGLLKLRGGSIFAALCRLRLPHRSRRIWADQCCINQEDLVERSQQVQFMNRIYKDADHVLVWLGMDIQNEAASAFGLVHELDEALRTYPGDNATPDRGTIDLETHIKEYHVALQALTDRPWVSAFRILLQCVHSATSVLSLQLV
jgi:Heterokaryon incompatibility protein (HET)